METKTLKSKSPLQGQKVTDKKLCDETRINLSGAVFGTDETTEKNEKMGYFPGKAEHHCNTDFELVNIVLRISKITIP